MGTSSRKQSSRDSAMLNQKLLYVSTPPRRSKSAPRGSQLRYSLTSTESGFYERSATTSFRLQDYGQQPAPHTTWSTLAVGDCSPVWLVGETGEPGEPRRRGKPTSLGSDWTRNSPVYAQCSNYRVGGESDRSPHEGNMPTDTFRVTRGAELKDLRDRLRER